MGWAHVSDLGWGSGPTLHGMQGVMAAIGPLTLLICSHVAYL
jgi:hypothetical protein